jgi:hypothetical protein
MTNDEARMTKECRSTNYHLLGVWALVLLSSFGFRYSSFGQRDENA